MALVTAKVVAKVATALIPKKQQKEMGQGILFLVLGALALPIILIIVLFGGNTEDKPDSFEQAFNAIGCDSEYLYQLEDVRLLDSYTKSNQLDENDLSVEAAKRRLEQIYFFIKEQPDTSKKVCLLRTDQEILSSLETKYKLTKEILEEIKETLEMIRNGRQNFISPIDTTKILTNFDIEKGYEGITFESTDIKEIKAIADGKIVEIKTSNDNYPTEVDGQQIAIKKGLTVVIEHEVQRGINDDGEYKMSKMYSLYTNLKDVKFNVGDAIKQSEKIGNIESSTFHFQLWEKDKKVVDPNRYMYLFTSDFVMPLDQPFSFTSPVGGRELGYHYGIDVAKDFGSPVYSITSGEVVDTNNTCSPNGGPSKCPAKGKVPWGGNYVVIKANVKGETYYIHYAHMEKTNASKGQIVYPGQLIGYQGNSGNSYGSHVHIEAHTKGVNPADKDTMFDVNKWLKLTEAKQ